MKDIFFELEKELRQVKTKTKQKLFRF